MIGLLTRADSAAILAPISPVCLSLSGLWLSSGSADPRDDDVIHDDPPD